MARQNRGLAAFAVKTLLFCFFAALLSTPAFANASVFVNTGVASCGAYGFCTASSLFGMLVGPSDAVNITGTTTILNDVAMSSGAKLTTTGTVNIGNATTTSILDFADNLTGTPAVPCTGSGCFAPNGSSLSTGTKVWGGTQAAATTVGTAYNQFTDLSAYWNTHTGVTSLGAPTMSGNWNIGTSAGVRLYTANTNLSQSADLVIGCGTNLASACDPTDLIVIVVPSSFTVNLTRSVSFAAASGLTDDQLLFLINATGSSAGAGAALQIGPGAKNTARTVHGDFFLPSGNFTVGSTNSGSTVNFYGRVFADAGAIADTFNQGVTVNDEPGVPEPSTWAAMISGLGALIYAARRRRNKQKKTEPAS